MGRPATGGSHRGGTPPVGTDPQRARRPPCRWHACRPGRTCSDALMLSPPATTRFSLAAEQLGHCLLMRDRTRTASSDPLPVACECRLNLGCLQDLSRSVALHRPEPPEIGDRDDRGGFPAEVDHFVRRSRIWVTSRMYAHAATVPAPGRVAMLTRQSGRAGKCGPPVIQLRGLVDDPLDLAAVDVEFAGYGALAVARGVQGPHRVLQTRRHWQRGWYTVPHDRHRGAHLYPWRFRGSGPMLRPGQRHEEFEGTGKRQRGPGTDRAVTDAMCQVGADGGSDPGTQAPRARGGTGWFRRSEMTAATVVTATAVVIRMSRSVIPAPREAP